VHDNRPAPVPTRHRADGPHQAKGRPPRHEPRIVAGPRHYAVVGRRRATAWRLGPWIAVAVLLMTQFRAPANSDRASFEATSLTQVAVPATADAYVSADAPTTAFGTSTRLTAGRINGKSKTAYLRFEIPAADVARVHTAHLVLTRDLHHLSGQVGISLVGANWDEHTITFQNAPQVGAVVTSAETSQATNTVNADVMTAVQGVTTASFAVTSTLTNDVVRFRSREATEDPPQLVLGLTDESVGSGCRVDAKLVSSCARWWGVAPRQWTGTPLPVGLAQDEAATGRTFDIVHSYHVNDQKFPTATERAIAVQPGKNRLLFLNWKPATDMTWAQVASGGTDARIDAEAAYLEQTFKHPFFLTIWHEPENDVIPSAGSGMTAADYAAMFRHVVLRLRADGATNAVTVMDYMGYVPWAQQSWFSQLWPGSAVVDWLGIDPYGSGEASGYLAGDFDKLVDRTGGNFAGYYTWATNSHPGIPIMVAEWGIEESSSNPGGKAAYFRSVAEEIENYPAIHALVYFDEPEIAGKVFGDTRPDSTAQSLAAFTALGHNPMFEPPTFHYSEDGIAFGQ
jgi:hypothetical protein